MGDNRRPAISTLLPNSDHFTQGQRHERFENVGVSLGEPDDDEQDILISLHQKMLSAVSGSVITSLLGKYLIASHLPRLTISSHTFRRRQSSTTITTYPKAVCCSTASLLVYQCATKLGDICLLSGGFLGVKQG
jgi:hypothetical protein